MATMTLALPEDLKREMDKLEYVNWSAVAREAIRERVAELALLNSIAAKSKLTEKDAERIAAKINESLYEAYKKKFPELE